MTTISSTITKSAIVPAVCTPKAISDSCWRNSPVASKLSDKAKLWGDDDTDDDSVISAALWASLDSVSTRPDEKIVEDPLVAEHLIKKKAILALDCELRTAMTKKQADNKSKLAAARDALTAKTEKHKTKLALLACKQTAKQAALADTLANLVRENKSITHSLKMLGGSAAGTPVPAAPTRPSKTIHTASSRPSTVPVVPVVPAVAAVTDHSLVRACGATSKDNTVCTVKGTRTELYNHNRQVMTECPRDYNNKHMRSCVCSLCAHLGRGAVPCWNASKHSEADAAECVWCISNKAYKSLPPVKRSSGSNTKRVR